jgi:hypothetical protein
MERRRLLLELVLLRPGQLPGEQFAVFSSAAARERAVREITITLKPHRHVVFDLYNEHDHPDGPISHADARRLRDTVKAIDSRRLVTISSTEYHLLNPQGVLDEPGLRNLRGEVGLDEDSVRVDLLAPHLTGSLSRHLTTLLAGLERLGRSMPIYVNEQQRARPGQPLITAETYLGAFSSARRAGAAGSVFHTAAGYDLKKISFGEGLNDEERRALSRLASVTK